MGWPLVRRGEVLEPEIDAIEIDAAAIYRMSGVYSFGRGLFHREPLQGSETTYKRFHRLSVGQVVLSQLKGWEGAIAVVDQENAGRFLSTQFPTFRCDESRAIIGYVGWFLKHAPNWQALRLKARGMGARRDTISPDKFLSLPLPLPPLAEQQRIVARLDRVAGLVAARARAVSAMEADMQAMLAKAFARCIADAPRRPMVEVAPLIRRPVEIELDGEYPELGVRSFGRGTFHKPALAGAEVGTKKLFEIVSGDLLFNIVFAWEGAVAIAQPEDAGRVGSHRFLTCVPEPTIATTDFLLFYFQSLDGLQRLGEASPGGAGRNRTLGLKKLEAIEVPVPPLETQHWFDRLQAKARRIRAIRAASARDADALIPALLHEVFGEKASAA